MNRLLILICCICAISATRVQKRYPRMVYGGEIEIEDAPYQVSVMNLLNKTHAVISCGGSILSKNLILTAGYCADLEPEKYLVGSGSTTWNEGGNEHKVVKIIRHEDWKRDRMGRSSHDIAIMKVEPEFDLDGKTAKIITLADKDYEVKAGDHAYVTGWGTTEDKTLSETLVRLFVKIADFEKCSEYLKHLGATTKYNICAQHPMGIDGVCTGDGGGPLMVKGKQVGIVSWGENACAVPGSLGVYTDVVKYREWIDKHMNI